MPERNNSIILMAVIAVIAVWVGILSIRQSIAGADNPIIRTIPIVNDDINATRPTAIQQIGGNITTGTISIGSKMTTGVLNLGSSFGNTIINIARGEGTKTVNIATDSKTNSVISIGSSTTVTHMRGIVAIDGNMNYGDANLSFDGRLPSGDVYSFRTTFITGLTPGMMLYAKADKANTGPASFQINDDKASEKTIVKGANTQLQQNDIEAGMIMELVYDGTNFQIMNPRHP